MKIWLVLPLLVVLAEGNQTRYDGYKVYRVIPNSEEQIQCLSELEKHESGVNFWNEMVSIGKPVDIMVPPHLQVKLVSNFKDLGANITVFVPDVQKLIDEETPSEDGPMVRLSFTNYNRYSVIQSYLAEQASLHSFAKVLTIGKTSEGREIQGISIAKGMNKPVNFIEAGMHSREWIGGQVALYIIDQLLNSDDPVVQKWTEDYEWYILPIANPDGLEYSHTTERLWRKTRSINPNLLCRGADANRNFGFMWGTGGSSTNPCDETFRGVKAFSEPESAAIGEFIEKVAARTVFYLALHSYSQLILLPYGVDHELPEHDNWMAVGERAATALATRYGTKFEVGSIKDILYVASGSSIDHVKGTYDNIKLALTYELRDTGTFGFLLPSRYITPSCLEFMDSLKSLMTDVAAMV